MTSKKMRENPLFMRNNYSTAGKWGLPIVKKQEIDLSAIGLIACSDTRSNDCDENKKKGVHFFVDDYRFYGIYDNPDRSLKKFSQYAFLLTPEYSLYADMNLWRQLESTAKNRWVGAYWQSKGITVIPSVCWGSPRSFDFCFDGIEKHSIVAVGMIGSKREHKSFMLGYNTMLNMIEPSAIIIFGSPFPEMQGDIIVVDYLSSRRVVRCHGR